MALEWDEAAKGLLETMHEAGFQCFAVGGAVRDGLLGRRPVDYDFATDARPGEILRLFPGSVQTGREFGTVTVPAGGRAFEVTPFRGEAGYADGRHPDEVRFGVTLEEDLARRDFTVNAMAFDGRELIDPFDGETALRERRLSAVGDAVARFSEDGLRILRGYRFASVLGFSLDDAAAAAALSCREKLAGVSCERVRNELQALLLGQNPAALDPFWAAGGLAPFGIPGGRSLAPLAAAPCGMLGRWWAFLHLSGAPRREVCRTLGFSAGFAHDLARLDALFFRPRGAVELKLLASTGLPLPMADILCLFCALDPAFEAERSLWEGVEAAGEPYRLDELPIDGKALIAMGVRGPEIGRRLRLLLDAVIAEPALNDAATLYNMARALGALDLR